MDFQTPEVETSSLEQVPVIQEMLCNCMLQVIPFLWYHLYVTQKNFVFTGARIHCL